MREYPPLSPARHTNAEPLIGFQTPESLGLVVITNAIRTDPETFTSKLLAEYADLFQGIGKMEGVQIDLHVDRTVTPVAQPHRRIPNCLACQATIPCHTREPLQMSDLPTRPWKKISVDFAGPFPNKDMALVFWDQYSRYPVVEAVIPQLKRVFTTYGIPEEMKTDNGPPFNGSKFAKHAQELGFRHRKITPGWAEANGDVERFMQTVKKSAWVAKIEGKAFKHEVQRTVGNYRATPHHVPRESHDKLICLAER